MQTGINSALDGDAILVRPGEYTENLCLPCGNANSSGSCPPPSCCTGGDCKAFTLEATSAIRGDTVLRQDTPAGSVITIGRLANPWPSSSLLTVDGFTVKNGKTSGIRVYNASPTIVRCDIVNNTVSAADGVCAGTESLAASGGGIYSTNSALRIDDCLISNNTVPGGCGVGGGISLTCDNCDLTESPRIVNTRIESNSAKSSGGGIFIRGFGLQVQLSNCIVSDNTVTDCISELLKPGGGGIAIEGKLGLASSGWAARAAVWTALNVTGCTFMRNALHNAPGPPCSGGAISAASFDTFAVVNSTFAQNTSDTGGSAIGFAVGLSSPSIRNSILYGNLPPQIYIPPGSSVLPQISYTDYEGGVPPAWDTWCNIANDCGLDASGRPSVGSPCIDAGLSSALPDDPSDVDGDGDFNENWPLDLDGKARFIRNLGPGVCSPFEECPVDMGAYEYGTNLACVVPDPLFPLNDVSEGGDVCVGGSNADGLCNQHSDCPGGLCHLKNRFVSGSVPTTASGHGLKVAIVSLDANSVAVPSNYNGTDRWVGTPTIGVWDGVSGVFNAARTQCVFLSTDWSAVGSLHIYGDVVVPTSIYDAFVCQSTTGPCSTPFRLSTARFGDIIPPLNVANFQDVQAVVAKFQGEPNGPSKTRTDVVGAVLVPPNPINFQDVSATNDAVKGKPYKQVVTTPPLTCP